jgi:hypothetical protein
MNQSQLNRLWLAGDNQAPSLATGMEGLGGRVIFSSKTLQTMQVVQLGQPDHSTTYIRKRGSAGGDWERWRPC